MRKPAIVFLALVFTACGLLGSQNDDPPEIPGKIVFAADDDKTSQIYTMNADGSDVEKLTDFPPEGGAADPAWSPDGNRIVFANYTNATTLGPYLYMMDADGNNMRPLKKMETESPEALIGSAPKWSPDGTKIAYQVCTNCELGGGNYEISVVEIAGEEYDPDQVHAVTDHPASDTHPTWNPDGNRIGFTSDRDYVDADTMRWRSDLYLIDADGSNLQRLTESGYPGGYIWMKTNELIQTVTDRNSNLKDILLLNIETENITTLMKDLKVKNQLWVFWDSVNQKLLTINKNHRELPVIIATYDRNGNPLQQLQSNSKELKSAIGFDWYIEKK